MSVILGIDPGFATVGYGVIDVGRGGLLPLAFGVIRTRPADGPAPVRLLMIRDRIEDLIRIHRPDVMAIEELFFARNTTSALQVSEARGVILMTAAGEGLEIYEYKPNQVKLAITGSGRADKEQMQVMIQRLLGLREKPRPDDAADGLSLALCHINRSRTYL